MRMIWRIGLMVLGLLVLGWCASGTELLTPRNGAVGVLQTGLDADDTSVVLDTGEGALFGSVTPYHVVIDEEVLEVTTRTGDTLTVVRGVESTTATTHNQGADVEMLITAEYVSRLNTAVVDGLYLVSLSWGGGDGVVRDAQTATYLKVAAVSGTPVMRVTVAPGFGLIAHDYERVRALWTSALIVAPSTNPRIDLVELTLNVGVVVKTGTEAGSPSAPALDANSIALGEVYCRVGMTNIKDADDSTNGYITDRRAFR